MRKAALLSAIGPVRRLVLCLVLGLLLAPLAVAQGPYGPENQLDLNRATLEELKALPLDGDVAGNILEYRTYRAYFGSVRDLLLVEGVTPALLREIAPKLYVTPPFEMLDEDLSAEELRAQEREYVLQRLLSQEGANEALVDEYIDQLRAPRNINNLNYYDLISYQNVSPVDAVAIMKELAQAGTIDNQRQLRNASGLSYWGYRNIRDFVLYEPTKQEKKFRGDYQVRMYNTPYFLDANDLMFENIGSGVDRNFDEDTYAGRLNLGTTSNPWTTNKLRMAYGRHLVGNLLTHRNLGEDKWDETVKFSLVTGNFARKGLFQLHRAALGHYRLAFGQGLFMDATDFYQPRKSGYGYGVRQVGIRPDLSRTDEYTLRGFAAEFSVADLRTTIFYSQDRKDAILNPDGSFNRYVTMTPRVSNEFMQDLRDDMADGIVPGADSAYYQNMRDVMGEEIIGANLKWEFVPGTYLGASGMQMRYWNEAVRNEVSNRFDPDPATLVIDPTDPRFLDDRDAEIGGAYNSKQLGDYRRFWGLEAQTVVSNVSLAGEYVKQEASTSGNQVKRIFEDGPDAFTANAYVQYENFNVLVLHRNYDVGFDNPYNRGFSEDPRYEQTILQGNAFRLNNPYFAQLGEYSAQPKSEVGWYFATRYRFSRQFTLSGVEFDTWKRKADDADLKRLVVRAEYSPVFPVQFRIRHRISSRHEDRPDDIRKFTSWDTRLEMRARLSRYDDIRFLFSTSNVRFSPRPRLNAPAGGGNTFDNDTPVAGIPAWALMGQFTHNFSDFMSLTLTSEIYDGFLYNFEDNEFIVLDGNGFRNWFMLRSRLSENLSWRFKWTHDHQLPRTYVDVRDFGELSPPTPDADNALQNTTSYRFQLDYSF